MPGPPRYAILRVLTEQDYLIPMQDPEGEATQINGWTLDQVIQFWFVDYSINSHHATRDVHRVGNGAKVLRVRKVP